MERRIDRNLEPQFGVPSRWAVGTPPARRDGFPAWLLVLALALAVLVAYLLLSQGAIAFAGSPVPGELPDLLPASGDATGSSTPGPTTTTALTPLVGGTPTSLPVSPTATPTPSSAATAIPTAEETVLPVVPQQLPLPTPTLPPPQPTEVPAPGEPHGDFAVTTSACAGCHRAHSAAGPALRKSWPEEILCFSCHAEDGPATDVEEAFAKVTNTATRFFKHDVAATNGVHYVEETEGSDFGGPNRHVECEDCHDPHASARGDTAAPWIKREMDHTSGVDPVWAAPGAPVGYNWLPEAEREYQVCFKCHSSFTTLPTYIPDGWDGDAYVPDGLRKLTYAGSGQVPDHRDLALEFSPYSQSFHPVVTVGRNQAIPAGSFVNGWSAGSMVYCTDCHANAEPDEGAVGPHGSPLLHLLAGAEDYQTASPDETTSDYDVLCFNCHDAEDYTGRGTDTNFIRNRANLHRQHDNNATCYLCHDTHGSEQLHLLNLDTSIETSSDTYLLPGYDGQPTNSQTFWQISPDGSEKTCWLVCHGHDHSNSPYPNASD